MNFVIIFDFVKLGISYNKRKFLLAFSFSAQISNEKHIYALKKRFIDNVCSINNFGFSFKECFYIKVCLISFEP